MDHKPTGIPEIDQDQVELERLQKRSDEAKGLVGKFFHLPHADSYAYYSVEDEKDSKVLVKWHRLLDAWQDNILGSGGWFEKSLIEPIVRREDSANRTFEEASRRQKAERAKRGASVTEAALADLGLTADVYELAHWCWERGHFGRRKVQQIDRRIYSSRELGQPGAGDLARHLAESKRFAAINALKDDIRFIMLADEVRDPIVYKNPPPPTERLLEAVSVFFKERLGIVPPKLELHRARLGDPSSTEFSIMTSGIVGKLWYDPANGAITQITVGFEWRKPSTLVR